MKLKTVLLVLVMVAAASGATAQIPPDTTPLTENCAANEYLSGDGSCLQDQTVSDNQGLPDVLSRDNTANGNNIRDIEELYNNDGNLIYDTSSGILYANKPNDNGGGLWISDDGGFYDYNDGWVRFEGSNGIDMNGNNFRNIGSLNDVDSTSQVANLNSDMLDGHDASQLCQSDGTNCPADDTGTDDQTLAEVLDQGKSANDDDIVMDNQNIDSLNQLNFNDDGPDGAIDWANGAEIYAAPLDDSNSDGYLQLVNDGGIAFEPSSDGTTAATFTTNNNLDMKGNAINNADVSVSGINMWIDSSMESGRIASSGGARSTTYAHTGSYSWKGTSSWDGPQTAQPMNLQAGKDYTISVWVKNTGSNSQDIHWYGDGNDYGDNLHGKKLCTISANTDWKRCSATLSPTSDTGSIGSWRLEHDSDASSGAVYFDDIQFERGTGMTAYSPNIVDLQGDLQIDGTGQQNLNGNLDMNGNSISGVNRVGGSGEHLDFDDHTYVEVQDGDGSRSEIVTQDTYINEDGVWLGNHIGDSDAHHTKTTDTNAATECTGADYLAGDGSCNVDSTEDHQDLNEARNDGGVITQDGEIMIFDKATNNWNSLEWRDENNNELWHVGTQNDGTFYFYDHSGNGHMLQLQQSGHIDMFNTLDMNNNNLNNINQLGDVDSTSNVANLNADMVDGHDASQLCQSDGTNCPTDNTGTDDQTLSTSGDDITIENGNTITFADDVEDYHDLADVLNDNPAANQDINLNGYNLDNVDNVYGDGGNDVMFQDRPQSQDGLYIDSGTAYFDSEVRTDTLRDRGGGDTITVESDLQTTSGFQLPVGQDAW